MSPERVKDARPIGSPTVIAAELSELSADEVLLARTPWGSRCSSEGIRSILPQLEPHAAKFTLKAEARLSIRAVDAIAFFDLFSNLPPADETALAVIQGGLDRGITPVLIARAARLLQGYELMYWDSTVEAAGL